MIEEGLIMSRMVSLGGGGAVGGLKSYTVCLVWYIDLILVSTLVHW